METHRLFGTGRTVRGGFATTWTSTFCRGPSCPFMTVTYENRGPRTRECAALEECDSKGHAPGRVQRSSETSAGPGVRYGPPER